MDAQQFDNLTKRLAGRFSRRGALRRAGAAASASVLASVGLRAAPTLAQDDGEPIYGMIRRYSLDDSAGEVRQALQKGYIEDACKAPGFIAYFAVEDEDGDFATVAVFRSQGDFENFASAEANWIAQNLGDLLPAPGEAISGPSYVHAGVPSAFRTTCREEPVAPTAAPAQPTAATTATVPTSVPAGPTPAPTQAPTPSCTGRGCACITGTQAPCDDGLICCPTTDLMGGPGVCQTQDVCYPDQCTAVGDGCDATCNWGDACPACCSNYCNATGQCDAVPAPCVAQGCQCDNTDPASCTQGLVCCAVQSGFICATPTQCGTPCTTDECACDPNDPNSCDQGLVCCAGQSTFVCVSTDRCGPTTCTSQGCDCIGGAQGGCDDGLMCCVQGDPGATGTCQTMDACPGSLCTGSGCACAMSDPSPCQEGLICCGSGEQGSCQTEADCAGGCVSNGNGCDPSCGQDASCDGCCSGYCNADGFCDDAPGS